MIFRQLILDQIHFHYLNHTRLVLQENFNIINVMLLVTILAQHNVAMLEQCWNYSKQCRNAVLR